MSPAARPLLQAYPRETGCSRSPRIETIRSSSSISSARPQQLAQILQND
jgi:hypothetical protein